MKAILTAIIGIASMAGFVSCKKDLVGEGPITTETRNVSNFSGIDLQMNGNVYYKNEPGWKFEVSAKQSIHSMLETNVVNGRLVIRYRNGKTYDADESIRINISGPNLNSFSLNTSGSIFCLNPLAADNIYLRTTGSGSIFLQQLVANYIEAESNMSGKIAAAGGSAIRERLKSDGSGKIDLSGISAEEVQAHVIGSGDILVKVAGRLDATIDGSGSVFFRGTPLIRSHIHGTGRLIRF